MTAADGPQDLIESVLALPQADRSIVLRRLTPQARQRLLPILQQAERKDFSGSLKKLIEAAAEGRIPGGMTANGAAALRRACDADAALPQPEQPGGLSGVIATLRKLLGLNG